MFLPISKNNMTVAITSLNAYHGEIKKTKMKELICERCHQPYTQDYQRLDVCEQCAEIIDDEEKLSERLKC